MTSSRKNYIKMGIIYSKDFFSGRKIDEATSNSSLNNMRYVLTEKPKWKVFKKKELVPIPARPRAAKGCPCGNDSPCKLKVSPKGVTIHYPQKKRRFIYFATTKRNRTKSQKCFFNNKTAIEASKVKTARPKKLTAWRLDNIKCNSPFLSSRQPDVFLSCGPKKPNLSATCSSKKSKK